MIQLELPSAEQVERLIDLYIGWHVGIVDCHTGDDEIDVYITGYHRDGADGFVYLDGYETDDDGNEIRPYSINTEEIVLMEVY